MTVLSFLRSLVRLYQRTLSPDHGLLQYIWPSGACRYTPTCSAYFLAATTQHGWRGLALTAQRLLRCHPWARGGYDPP